MGGILMEEPRTEDNFFRHRSRGKNQQDVGNENVNMSKKEKKNKGEQR
jgi:hypothetical protein